MSLFTIAIHGGAGTLLKSEMSPEKEKAYREGLEQALNSGYEQLAKGGSAPDAVMTAVMALEDCELFNAGKGSVFTHDGRHEMDAAIMDGQSGRCGAVAGVSQVRNPILLSRRIMENSGHILLAGNGALKFAEEQGLKLENEAYFFNQYRYDQLLAIRDSGRTALDHGFIPDKKFGTVGAVACDAQGHIAAATSTGGMTNKKYNRVGDSPLIGSGTYAKDATCAISCTGHGEKFMQAVAAYDVSCLMEYKGISLEEAMRIVVEEKLPAIAGEGGMIGVDAKGNAALLFNSEGMYRGMRNSQGDHWVAIFK